MPADNWSNFFDHSTHYTGPTLTESMIAQAEQLLSYKLPQAYIKLLRMKNGGVPRCKCFPTAGTSWSDNHVQVTTIFGVGGRWGIDSESLGSKHMIAQAGLPEIGIVVGWTPTAGHDAIMLDYSICGSQNEPQITHVDGESGDVQILAPTFEDFIRGLVDCRPYEEQRIREMEAFKRRTQQ